MSVSLKVQVIAVIILGVSSFIWFLLGVTAGFQRGMDIIGSTLLTFVTIPLLLLVGGITSTLVKQWTQTSDTDNKTVATPKWTGSNNDAARQKAAKDIEKDIVAFHKKYPKNNISWWDTVTGGM